jgi:tetratricopeptide (TPR) repeat protein
MKIKYQACRSYFKIILFIIFVHGSLLFAQSEEQTFKKADELITAGKFKDAVESLQAISTAGENSPARHLKLGIAYKGLYQFDLAKTELEEALRLSPDSPEILYALGGCYKSLDRLDDAESAFQKSFLINSGNVNAAVDLCTIFMMQNKYDSAAVVYNKLLENDTTNSYFYKQLGNCYVKIDSVSGAILNYEKSLNYNPKDAGTFARLAQVF